MGRIIDIDSLLPPDATIRWRGLEWSIPGDMPVSQMLALQEARNRLMEAAKSEDQSKGVNAFHALAETVGSILAIRQPGAAAGLQFGMRELGIVAEAIGIAVSGEELVEQGNE